MTAKADEDSKPVRVKQFFLRKAATPTDAVRSTYDQTKKSTLLAVRSERATSSSRMPSLLPRPPKEMKTPLSVSDATERKSAKL